MLYARKFVLRNCGRFTHVKSDFGSYYHTHLFLTSEALYAGLTRETTRRGKAVDLEHDIYQFDKDYDISEFPIWFSPGIFENFNGDSITDFTDFNVICECYPSTNKAYFYKKGILTETGRPNYVPTYGTIESVLPGHKIHTCGISKDKDLLDGFIEKQTFVMGKKRTMFQIENLSETLLCKICSEGDVDFCQLNHKALSNFSEYEIAAATGRYLLIKGMYRGEIIEADFKNEKFAFPTNSIPKEIKI